MWNRSSNTIEKIFVGYHCNYDLRLISTNTALLKSGYHMDCAHKKVTPLIQSPEPLRGKKKRKKNNHEINMYKTQVTI